MNPSPIRPLQPPSQPQPQPKLQPRPISLMASPTKSDSLESCAYRYWQQQCNPQPETREQQIGKAYHEFMPVYVSACLLAKQQAMPQVVDECVAKCGADWPADIRDEVTALARCTARDYSVPAGAECFGQTIGRKPFEWEWAFKKGPTGGPVYCEYNDPEAVGNGRIDWPFLCGSWVWCLDYKTGRFDPEEIPVDRGQVPKERQPRWYLWAAHEMFQAEKFVWATFHPRTGKLLTAQVKRAQIIKADIWQEILAEHAALQVRLEADRKQDYETAWPCNPSAKWCEGCEFGPQKGNDTCPYYNRQREGVAVFKQSLSIRSKQETQNMTATETTPPTATETAPVAAPAEVSSDSPAPLDAPAAIPAGWEVADDSDSPRFKLFIFGDTGTYKTRSILTAFASRKPCAPGEAARLAIVDTENGTEHYKREFAFLRKLATTKENIVAGVLDPPPGVESIAIDSFTDFCDLVKEWWTALYLIRERGAGNKRDYYTLQPRDYENINADIRKMVRALIDRADLNVIVTAKPKAQYAEGGEMMKKTGETFDAHKRTPFFFDTVLHLTKADDGSGRVMAETKRDRTNRFPVPTGGLWEYTPEILAEIVKRPVDPRQQPQPVTSAADDEAAQFDLIRSAKTLSKINDADYKSIVAKIGGGATSAKQLTYSQRSELIEELEEIAASVPF